MKQDAFQDPVPVAVPPLGVGGQEIEFVSWLVPTDSEVIVGERIAELLTHGILFHLDAPAAGRLSELCCSAGDRVREGDILAWIRHIQER